MNALFPKVNEGGRTHLFTNLSLGDIDYSQESGFVIRVIDELKIGE